MENSNVDPYEGLIVEIDPERESRVLTFEGRHYRFSGFEPLEPGIEVPTLDGHWRTGSQGLHEFIETTEEEYQQAAHRLIRIPRGYTYEP